jgi:hypothetical protein
MIVMPANGSGWFWHSLARETRKLGHLFSPRGERGPWPWLPYALDNGAFSCWNPKTNTFDAVKWAKVEIAWKELVRWAAAKTQKPRWALLPDTPGNAVETLAKWRFYREDLPPDFAFPSALAVQDGMTVADVRQLSPAPDLIFVGGSDDYKWGTAEMWCKEFPRVHVGRVNSPQKLPLLESWGCESCDGTGWNRGDSVQTSGLEKWCRKDIEPSAGWLWPHVCRATLKKRKPKLKPAIKNENLELALA